VLDVRRQLVVENLALIRQQLELRALFEVEHVVAEQVAAHLRLLERLHVHEGEEFAVVVQVLDDARLDANILDAVAGGEGHLARGPAAQVAHGDADGRVAATGLVVVVVQHLV